VCPLLGKGYLLLGELCFLDGGRESAKSAYVAQALEVRPFDGTVLLHAGSEAILRRDLEQGLAYWRDSFRRGPIYQEQIIDWFVGRVYPWDLQKEIEFFLEKFEPDLEGLRLLERRYRRIAQPEQMVALREACVRAVEAEARAAEGRREAELWLEAMLLYHRLGRPARRLECGRNALRLDPDDFRVHQSLAFCLADLERFDEAKEHLEWCLRREPHDQRLHKKMSEVMRREALRRYDRRADHRPAQRGLAEAPSAVDPGGVRQARRVETRNAN
jgi:tetratricopeptide (TPR) repeat protein